MCIRDRFGGGLSTSQVQALIRTGVADWAENLNTSLIPTSKLGTGTANSSKVLYGDRTWKNEPSGGSGGGLVAINDLYDANVTISQPAHWVSISAVWPTDKDWGIVATGINSTGSTLQADEGFKLIDIAAIRALTAQSANTAATTTAWYTVVSGDAFLYLGRTSSNGILVASSSSSHDPNPLVIKTISTGSGSALTQTQVDNRVRAGVYDWAEQDNTDAIPVEKLSNAPSGGLDTNAVDARIAQFARDGALTGDTVQKVQDILDAFLLGGWINAAGAGSTQQTAPYVREELQTTPYNATNIKGGNYGADYQTGPHRAVHYFGITIPLTYQYPLEQLRLRIGGGLTHDQDPDDPGAEQWLPLTGPNVRLVTTDSTYNYYELGPENVPAGDNWRIQRNTPFELNRNRIGGDELLPDGGEDGQIPVSYTHL